VKSVYGKLSLIYVAFLIINLLEYESASFLRKRRDLGEENDWIVISIWMWNEFR
jgi:hypothetical protein